jgi:hypothetical protein
MPFHLLMYITIVYLVTVCNNKSQNKVNHIKRFENVEN